MLIRNIFGLAREQVSHRLRSQSELDVLLSELKSKEDLFQSLLRNEASNFLALFGSISAAATIYVSQALKAEGLNRDVPDTLILGLALAFVWFPVNQAWHMAELRAVEKYWQATAEEIRRVVSVPDNSQMLTWVSFRLQEIAPSWRHWHVTFAMIARGAFLYFPSVSLATYSYLGLNGQGTFDSNDPLQWLLLSATLLGILASLAALILPYLGAAHRKQLGGR